MTQASQRTCCSRLFMAKSMQHGVCHSAYKYEVGPMSKKISFKANLIFRLSRFLCPCRWQSWKRHTSEPVMTKKYYSLVTFSSTRDYKIHLRVKSYQRMRMDWTLNFGTQNRWLGFLMRNSWQMHCNSQSGLQYKPFSLVKWTQKWPKFSRGDRGQL